ncbi:FtsK/SpoIIIE domain-containing protein [Microbacterium sp.]|uniref:FtsK/SpoIIIE domain-containing protein n=1 Tax=Microbacterium sp. TaxID=51671 RepID=UPI002734630C|nr:FtsK/SpoIIIE domain-containing protein [Microbacterium sp.]MDP3953188.1 FtsK/SpoIIIE domain-containing protein [Microbacterium sp.]
MSDLLWTAVNYALLGLATVAILGWAVSQLGGGKKKSKVVGGRLMKTGSRSLVLRLVRTAVWFAKAVLLGWMGDLPGSVNPEPGLESLRERREQMVAAIAWPTVAVLLILGGVALPALLVGSWSIIVVARRVMASRGHSWRARRMLADARFWAKRRLWIGGPLAVIGVAMPLWLALFYDREAPLAWTIPYGTWVGCAALVAFSEMGWRTRATRVHRALAQAHGVTPKVIAEEAVLRPGSGREMRMALVPPAVIAHLDRADAGIAEQMPEYEVEVHRADGSNRVTAITYRPTTAETMGARDLLAATNGMLLSLTPVGEPLPWRPDEHLGRLDPTVGGTKGGELDALLRERGFHVVDWRPAAHEVSVARLGPKTAALRDAVCRDLGLRELWEVEIAVTAGPDGPRQVLVTRSPGMGGPEKRRDEWGRVAASLLPVGPGERWRINDDPSARTVTLLRETDPLLEIQPYPWAASPTLTAIPFGVREDGAPLTLGLLEVNQLLGGTPGGGKSGGLTALLCGVARLENVALIGLDPKKVEQAPWRPRFSRIARTEDEATDVLERLVDEMERRYDWLESQGQKKFTADLFTRQRPLLVLVIDELADLVSVAVEKEEKAAETARSTMIRRLIAKGRASGVVIVAATQKPQSDVVPTALRDMIQLRVCYATTNAAMTDTVLGAGMAQNGGLSHEITASQRGVCFVVSESSRTPVRARTYWVPDEEVAQIARDHAHLRVPLPWLDDGASVSRPRPAEGVDSITALGTMSLTLDDLAEFDTDVPAAAVSMDPATDFDDEEPQPAPARPSIWG